MITQGDYLQMLSRLEGNKVRELPNPEAAEVEGDLQEACISACRARGWFVVFSRMDLPTTLPLGTPDLIVAADNSRVFWVECKSASGKMRPAQLGVKLMLEKLGHTVHVVSSLEAFLKIVL